MRVACDIITNSGITVRIILIAVRKVEDSDNGGSKYRRSTKQNFFIRFFLDRTIPTICPYDNCSEVATLSEVSCSALPLVSLFMCNHGTLLLYKPHNKTVVLL